MVGGSYKKKRVVVFLFLIIYGIMMMDDTYTSYKMSFVRGEDGEEGAGLLALLVECDLLFIQDHAYGVRKSF